MMGEDKQFDIILKERKDVLLSRLYFSHSC